ncbi:hypothetical protein HYH02_001962 [Chlamydomonas schloesseri]|uniref:AAA+ ATPase domain-containing protein n=1 Tax=Chlamydomonas schloesseri TaxID=2026947 RepID=A0A835WW57_9CHLO|nr:hypothetical protein HYH02_001962 [Chlamydomonas schloesseri]|eukprot:KAG2453751.1 hypothetical protein HYH02_001962 [Chlamydomonas schloesseri]
MLLSRFSTQALRCRRGSASSWTSVRPAAAPVRAVRCRYQVERAGHIELGEPDYAEALAPEVADPEDGTVVVQDDLDQLLTLLPEDIREPLVNHPQRASLVEVVLDLGRQPEARFQGIPAGEYLRKQEVTAADLEAAVAAVGDFGADNRAGVPGTLHRISAIRNRRGAIIGLTCRVGRAVSGHIAMLKDLVESGHSVLLLGRPGVGKTTVIREMCATLADEYRKRVVIVDTSNEIGGDGDVPHPAIGGARRMQVADALQQHAVMIEAVENHMPQVVVVDEIGTEAEALACRTIAERGVQLIGTAHGCLLENLIKNPTLSDLVGGVAPVTLGDEEARLRGTQKTILERKAPPTFPIVVEIRARNFYVAHWVEDSVDQLLLGRMPVVQVRERDTSQPHGLRVSELSYDSVPDPERTADPSRNSWDEDYEAALRDMHGSGGGPSAGNWAWADKIKARGKEAGSGGASLPGSGGMAGPGARSFAIAGRSAGPNVPPPPAVGAKKASKKGKK